MNILTFNAGSSSYKLSFYCLENDKFASPLWKGSVVKSEKSIYLKAETSKGKFFEKELKDSNSFDAIKLLLESLWSSPLQVRASPSSLDRIGHRIVHGGTAFDKPIQITPEVKSQIKELASLAPLHQPTCLEGIEFFENLFPSIIQIAVFDTSFHHSMSEMAKTYALPKNWRDYGIQRYGFHGISHQYCTERLSALLNKPDLKIVNCHLGSGCSICAIDHGKSIATTMGFTPMEGLVMGTRCGSIDPAILLYLMDKHGYSLEDLQEGLNFDSGLKALAGTTDMQIILSRSDHKAKLAFNVFIFHLKAFIGSMVATLGGIDVLSFTGGIGENSSAVRAAACQGLEFLQLKIDPRLNQEAQSDQEIAKTESRVRIFVIHTQEEWIIARACFSNN